MEITFDLNRNGRPVSRLTATSSPRGTGRCSAWGPTPEDLGLAVSAQICHISGHCQCCSGLWYQFPVAAVTNYDKSGGFRE